MKLQLRIIADCYGHEMFPPSLASLAAFFFIFLKNVFYKNIFSVSHFTVLYLYRPAGGGRDLYVNRYNFFARRPMAGAYRPLPGGRHLPPGGGRQAARPPGRGAAGSPKYKS